MMRPNRIAGLVSKPQKQTDVSIRWLIRRDMVEVLKIEHESFELPWTEEDFLSCIQQSNCIGMVAEYDEKIVGFMIYELHKFHLNLRNFAVATDARQRRIGSQMAQKLIEKLGNKMHPTRSAIEVMVRESNLAAQMFFGANGFRAVLIVKNHYEAGEDGYFMRYSH